MDQYGIIKGEEIEPGLYKVTGLVEKPVRSEAPSNIAILGRYIITPEIFEILETTKPGKGGEIQLTDALMQLLTRQQIYAYSFAGRRYDIGSKLGFLKATVEFALEQPELQQDFADYLTEIVKQF